MFQISEPRNRRLSGCGVCLPPQFGAAHLSGIDDTIDSYRCECHPGGSPVSPNMPFQDLQEFLRYLERDGQLKRIRAEVDPVLEAGEIAQRVLNEGGPALLFERPIGSS